MRESSTHPGGVVLDGVRTRRAVAVSALVVVLIAAWSTGGAVAGAQVGSVPGVTPKEIRVGAVIGKTNPTGVAYEEVVQGAQARFQQINNKGGLFGRKLKFVASYDDQTRDSKSIAAARSLVEEDKVFAAFVASQNFAGADTLVKAGTPTFGYNIQIQWSKGPNLFGAYGSYNCPDCPSVSPVYAAHQAGAKHVGVFAYGNAPSSVDCAGAIRRGFDLWGPKVAVFDTSLAFGFSANDVSAITQAMKDNQVDFVATCMDIQGEVNLSKSLQAAGVTGVKFYAPQGYDAKTLKELGTSLDGFTFPIQFVPFELAKGNQGMTDFVNAMNKLHLQPSENLLVGWVGAGLLAEGIKASGKKFTQQSVVDAINQMTDWNADDTIHPVNWKTAHGPAAPGEKGCFAYVTVKDGKFAPVYGQPGKPLICFPENPYPASLDSPTFIG